MILTGACRLVVVSMRADIATYTEGNICHNAHHIHRESSAYTTLPTPVLGERAFSVQK